MKNNLIDIEEGDTVVLTDEHGDNGYLVTLIRRIPNSLLAVVWNNQTVPFEVNVKNIHKWNGKFFTGSTDSTIDMIIN